MTNEEFFDIGRVAYITGNVQEALAAKQALEKVVENANSLQQLKDSIAALAVEMEHAVYPDFSPVETRKVITKMLLLSGRNKYNAATASV